MHWMTCPQGVPGKFAKPLRPVLRQPVAHAQPSCRRSGTPSAAATSNAKPKYRWASEVIVDSQQYL